MRRIFRVLVVAGLLAAFALPAAAKQNESTDPGYNFAAVRTVLVMAPALTFNGYDASGDNRFVKYPDAAGKIAAMLNGKLKKVANLRYVTMDYVTERVKADADPELDPKSAAFAALVRREMPKHVDLVLYLTVRDFGWFHEYRSAYEAWETVTDRVRWHGRTSDGKEVSGWKEIERQVFVYHPPHYDVYDCAEANLALLDTRTGKYVWSYADVRSRVSPGNESGGYDRSGPESMMNRIFDEAMDRMPIYPKPQSAVYTYS